MLNLNIKVFYTLVLYALISHLSIGANIKVENSNDSGNGSLREAINDAQKGDTVYFSPNLLDGGSQTLLLKSVIKITKPLFIRGLYNDSDTLYISGDNQYRVFSADSISNLYLDSLVIIDTKTSIGWRGGGILFNESDSLFVTNSIFMNNKLGAIHATTSYSRDRNIYVEINHCIYNGNRNNGNSAGGIIHVSNGSLKTATLNINNTIFNNNYSYSAGGAVAVQSFSGSSVLYIDSCQILNSTTGITSSAGGAYVRAGKNAILKIDNSTISNNSAGSAGAGIGVYSSKNTETTILNSRITNNKVINTDDTGRGGGVRCSANNKLIFFLDNTLVDSNTSDGSGGGVYLTSEDSLITNISHSTISNNISSRYDGGIKLSTDNYLSSSISHSTINNNTALFAGGGGIGCYSGAWRSTDTLGNFLSIVNSTISMNEAGSTISDIETAGGIFMRGAKLHLKNTTTVYNTTTSTSNTGGVYAYHYQPSSADFLTITSQNSIFAFNSGIQLKSKHKSRDMNSFGHNICSTFFPTGYHHTDLHQVTEDELKLGKLTNNGGKTNTHAPLTGSIAINSGTPDDFSDAQNGKIIGRREIGAAEYNGLINNLNQTLVLDKLNIYPNPSTEIINIDNHMNEKIFIYSFNGSLVMTSQNSKISISSLEPGIYFVKKGLLSTQFIKQ